jgi:hypothetical protein
LTLMVARSLGGQIDRPSKLPRSNEASRNLSQVTIPPF